MTGNQGKREKRKLYEANLERASVGIVSTQCSGPTHTIQEERRQDQRVYIPCKRGGGGTHGHTHALLLPLDPKSDLLSWK